MSAAAAQVPEIRANLYLVAERIRSDIEGRAQVCARSREWSAMQLTHRMAVMLLAGIDGELSDLSRRAWREFTPAERLAVQVAIRSLHEGLQNTYALRVRAGE